MSNEIEHELKYPVKYSPGNGQEIESNQVILKRPNGKVSHICCEIESLIQGGILKMANVLDSNVLAEAQEAAQEAKAVKTIDDLPEAPDEETVLSIMSGGGVDMKKVVLNFRELFKEVALIGGEKNLTHPIMDRMDHQDFRRMMGKYAANFIMT